MLLFSFAQIFFEKNIFFSQKPLDKIEKVWYNIYTEKESAKHPTKSRRKQMKLTNEMIEKAIAAIKADEIHETFGIRTQDVPFEMGEIDHKSVVWIDGEITDEELDGVCATDIDPDDIVKSLSRHANGGYEGEHIAILAGSYAASGDDPFEVVMENPDVIAILA